jgi:biotin carboxyl carrier protein
MRGKRQGLSEIHKKRLALIRKTNELTEKEEKKKSSEKKTSPTDDRKVAAERKPSPTTAPQPLASPPPPTTAAQAQPSATPIVRQAVPLPPLPSVITRVTAEEDDDVIILS